MTTSDDAGCSRSFFGAWGSIVAAALFFSAGIDRLLALEVTNPPQCLNCFIGELMLSPNPADASGSTKRLDSDMYFVDAQGLVWKAGAGDVTDGASIPELLRPIVGGPWEKSYLPAAVMHDHYTKDAHKVRTWQATARMFYAAMIVNEVEIVRAKMMYYAVYTFGPHWDKLKPGNPCGNNCIFSATTEVTFKPADYSDGAGEKSRELSDLKALIAKREIAGQPVDLSEIENIARAKHSSNAFFAADKTR